MVGLTARQSMKVRPASSQSESPSQLDASASAALRCSSRQASLVRKPAASTALPSNLSSSYKVFFELDQDRLVTEAEFDSLSSPALRRAATTEALVVPLAVTRFCLARIGSELRQQLVQRQWRAERLAPWSGGSPRQEPWWRCSRLWPSTERWPPCRRMPAPRPWASDLRQVVGVAVV